MEPDQVTDPSERAPKQAGAPWRPEERTLPPPGHQPWTTAEDKLLGTMMDRDLAQRLGRPLEAVKERRRILLIAHYYPAYRRLWTPAEEQLLGTMSDERLARRLKRSVETVRTRCALDLFFAGGPMLGARAAAAPDRDGEPVQFTLASRPKGKPLELRVRLSESSSRDYEVVNAPLTLRTPRTGSTNYVTVQVRSRGSAHITTNSSKELVPPLSFEAEVNDSRGSTLVYGPRVKVGALVP